MTLPYRTRAYEHWVPFIVRLIFGTQFLIGAFFKVTMFQMQVGVTAAAGVPFPEVAVGLAFVLELVAGIALIIGWKTRLAAFLLALYVLILTFVFYRNVVDATSFGALISHLSLAASMLYVSVYGTQHLALKKDVLPA